jgi:hypothetical protein
MCFPVQAKCVTFDAGYQQEQENAREALELGKAYTIRQMIVGQSSSHLELYGVKGQWNSCFFDAYSEPEDEDFAVTISFKGKPLQILYGVSVDWDDDDEDALRISFAVRNPGDY